MDPEKRVVYYRKYQHGDPHIPPEHADILKTPGTCIMIFESIPEEWQDEYLWEFDRAVAEGRDHSWEEIEIKD